MPIKQRFKVVKAKNSKRARIALSFEFNIDDPQAQRIFKGVGMCLREALTEEEQREFLSEFEIERAKILRAG